MAYSQRVYYSDLDPARKRKKDMLRPFRSLKYAYSLTSKSNDFYRALEMEGRIDAEYIDLKTVHQQFDEIIQGRRNMNDQFDYRSREWVTPPNTRGCVMCQLHGPPISADSGCPHDKFYATLIKAGRKTWDKYKIKYAKKQFGLNRRP